MAADVSGLPERAVIPAVMRHQLLALRELIDAILADEDEQAVGSACAHPSEKRVNMASMGKDGDHFYCKACGETIGGD